MAAAQTVAKTLGDASHDITHDFYGAWLMSDDATMKSETTAQASGGHGAEVVGLDGTSKALVLGGFGSLNLLVVAAAFFLKRTMAREAAVKAAHQVARVAKGSDQ